MADVHLAPHRRFAGEGPVNERAQTILRTLYAVTAVAEENGCIAVVIAGDVFDTDRPPPQLVAALQEWCRDHTERLGSKPRLIAGNHDRRSNIAGDHALSPLADHAYVIDTVRTDIDAGVLYIPFRTAARGWFEEDVRLYGKPCDLVVAHIGVCFDTTPEWLWGKNDALSVEEMTAAVAPVTPKLVVVGNYHTPGGAPGIVQCGTLCPAGWDDPGEDFGWVVMVEVGTDRVKRVRVPGPRFLQGDVPPEDLARFAADGNTVYYRATVAPGETVPPRYVLPGVTVDRVEDASATRAKAQEAVAAARSADNTAAAVSEFVAKMTLPEGVTAAEVEARVKKLLVGGAL